MFLLRGPVQTLGRHLRGGAGEEVCECGQLIIDSVQVGLEDVS